MNLFVLSTAQEFWHSRCDNNANFTINGAYQRNLNNALSSISSDTSITYGFYNKSVGETPDQVNVIALCRGDVEQDDCLRCVDNTSITLRGLCPNQKNAFGTYESCMVRYSDTIILSNLNTDIEWDMANHNNASNVDQFNQALDPLWRQLRSEASRGGSFRKYASNSTQGPRSTTIFGLVQCTPDLSETQCFNCLADAMDRIQRCCDGKIGARVVYASCNIRYEIYDFFNDTVLLPSQPPSQLSSPPPLLTSPSSGKSSNTMITVIAVFATISVVILVVI